MDPVAPPPLAVEEETRPRRGQKAPPNINRLVKDGDLDKVKEMVEGEDGMKKIEERGMWENTPLILACQYGYKEVRRFSLPSF